MQQLEALAGQLRDCPHLPAKSAQAPDPSTSLPMAWHLLFGVHYIEFCSMEQPSRWQNQALTKPFGARAQSAADVGSDDPYMTVRFRWCSVRFLFFALFQRGTNLLVLHAMLVPVLRVVCF